MFIKEDINVAAFTNAFSGCIFKQTADTSLKALKAIYAGRYRISGQYTGDFQDLKLYACVPLKKSSTDASFTLATKLISDDINGASTVEVGCLPICHRGFTGTATLDPDPATDMGLYFEFDVTLLANDYLAVALGIRTYNSVSSTTANFTFKTGTGTSYFEIAYLGPNS